MPFSSIAEFDVGVGVSGRVEAVSGNDCADGTVKSFEAVVHGVTVELGAHDELVSSRPTTERCASTRWSVRA